MDEAPDEPLTTTAPRPATGTERRPREETREERWARFEKREGWVGLLFLIIVAVLGARPFVNWLTDKFNNLDDHPRLAIYLLGCVLAPALALVSVIAFRALAWITKANVLAKNLEKLQTPTTKAPFPSRVLKFLALWLFEIALSWISVALQIWRSLGLLLRTAREVLSSQPESIKMLYYPLKNDPQLSVESVWAYVFALGVRGGSPPRTRPLWSESWRRFRSASHDSNGSLRFGSWKPSMS